MKWAGRAWRGYFGERRNICVWYEWATRGGNGHVASLGAHSKLSGVPTSATTYRSHTKGFRRSTALRNRVADCLWLGDRVIPQIRARRAEIGQSRISQFQQVTRRARRTPLFASRLGTYISCCYLRPRFVTTHRNVFGAPSRGSRFAPPRHPRQRAVRW